MCDAVHSSRTCTHAHDSTGRGTVRGCHKREKLDARLLYRGSRAFLTAAAVVVLEK